MASQTDKIVAQVEVAMKGLNKLDRARKAMLELDRAQITVGKNGQFYAKGVMACAISQKEALDRLLLSKLNEKSVMKEAAANEIALHKGEIARKRILANIERNQHQLRKRRILEIKKLEQQQQQRFMGLKNMLMGAGLSFLFTGMAIKNFFQNILTGLMQNFLLIEGETGSVNNQMDNLKASLLFLQYTLIEAFAEGGGLDWWITKVQELIDWFVGLDDGAKSFIINFMIGAVLIGGAMMLIGQLMLGVLGIIAVLEFFGVKSMGGLFIAIFKLVLIAALLVAAFIIIKETLDSDLHPALKFLIIMLTVILVLMALVGLGALALSLPWIIAIGAIIAGILLLSNHLGSLKNGFLALGIFLLAILAMLGDSIYNTLILPLRLVISTLNSMIRAYNLLTGSDYATIKQPDILPLSKKVWEMRNDLIAQAEEEKAAKGDSETGIPGLLDATKEQLSMQSNTNELLGIIAMNTEGGNQTIMPDTDSFTSSDWGSDKYNQMKEMKNEYELYVDGGAKR